MKIPSELILTEEHLDRAIKALAATKGKDWVRHCVIAQLGIDTIGEVTTSGTSGFANGKVEVRFHQNLRLYHAMKEFDAKRPEAVRPLLPITIRVAKVEEWPPQR